jgi:hypothetical protein
MTIMALPQSRHQSLTFSADFAELTFMVQTIVLKPDSSGSARLKRGPIANGGTEAAKNHCPFLSKSYNISINNRFRDFSATVEMTITFFLTSLPASIF